MFKRGQHFKKFSSILLSLAVAVTMFLSPCFGIRSHAASYGSLSDYTPTFSNPSVASSPGWNHIEVVFPGHFDILADNFNFSFWFDGNLSATVLDNYSNVSVQDVHFENIRLQLNGSTHYASYVESSGRMAFSFSDYFPYKTSAVITFVADLYYFVSLPNSSTDIVDFAMSGTGQSSTASSSYFSGSATIKGDSPNPTYYVSVNAGISFNDASIGYNPVITYETHDAGSVSVLSSILTALQSIASNGSDLVVLNKILESSQNGIDSANKNSQAQIDAINQNSQKEINAANQNSQKEIDAANKNSQKEIDAANKNSQKEIDAANKNAQDIMNSYDSSGMESDGDRFAQSQEELEKVEDSLFTDAISGFNSLDMDHYAFNLFGDMSAAMSFVSSFLQSVYVKMGDFNLIVTIGLVIMLASKIIGIYRFSTG